MPNQGCPSLSVFDRAMCALAVWREARGAIYPAKLAVAAVIRNRASDAQHRWPRNVADVVTQRYQFSSFNHGDPNATLFPKSSDAVWTDSLQAVEEIFSGAVEDPTGGANFYFSAPVTAPPADWGQVTQTAVVGPFICWRG